MEIKISFEYPRPLTIVVLMTMAIAFVWSFDFTRAPVQADLHSSEERTVFYRNGEEMPRGGPDGDEKLTRAKYVRLLKLEHAILERKTDILREQLSVLERRAVVERSPEIRDAKRRLVALFYDERALEEELIKSLREMQVAHDHAQVTAERVIDPIPSSRALVWPIEPMYGISAGFHDAAYAERFGFEHQAIDIPALQGSVVYAAADGMVKEVSDHGLGFNSVTIAHNGGMATLYGHVREFLVKEGQYVTAGDPIARSGGMPGTPGAGMLSTGPHLHFEVITGGEAVDPLAILPSRFFNPTWVRVPTELRARLGSSA